MSNTLIDLEHRFERVHTSRNAWTGKRSWVFKPYGKPAFSIVKELHDWSSTPWVKADEQDIADHWMERDD